MKIKTIHKLGWGGIICGASIRKSITGGVNFTSKNHRVNCSECLKLIKI